MCGHHRYFETSSIASWPGWPRWILFSTAWRNCPGTASLLFTNIQSSTTESWCQRGFVYGPIDSKLWRSFLSITRRSLSIQASSEINSANRLLSNNLVRLSRLFSVLVSTWRGSSFLELWVIFYFLITLTSWLSDGFSAVRSTTIIGGFSFWTFVSNSCSRLLLSSSTVRASSSSMLFGLSDFSAPMRSQNDIRFVSANLPDVISLYPLGLIDFFTVRHSTWGTSESEVSESCLLHAALLFTMRAREKVVSVLCSVNSSLRSSFCLFIVFFDFPDPDWFFSILLVIADCFEILMQSFSFEFLTDCLLRDILFNVFFSFCSLWKRELWSFSFRSIFVQFWTNRSP